MGEGTFAAATREYRWLLDRGYPTSGSLKLVGDRHRLDRDERQILFRGVTTTDRAHDRRRRLVSPRVARNATIGVDGHNVLLTIANYLRGVRVFEADDGLLRDIGGVHGKVRNGELIERAISILADEIVALQPKHILLCFDEPVSHSRRHGRFLADELEDGGCSVELHVTRSADYTLKGLAMDMIATSDSALIDSCGVPVVDLARSAMVRTLGASFSAIER